MKLSKKCDYALRTLIFMATRPRGEYVKVAVVAKEEDIPLRYLEQISLALRNAGLLNSKSGPGGGYRLAKAPGEISLGQVVRLIDGPVAPVRCVSHMAYEKCPRENICALRPIMNDVRDAIAGILDSMTIEDACRRAGLLDAAGAPA